ncbi:MAG: DUF1704 domain-containing protein [Candidatus Kerfeldbacteria bacterium]|nr:DUF1704 domain-containing protein [Candidatus Kerfeldbacteria bacterium]
MSFMSTAGGILGINARNLLYVSRFNSKKNRRLADDKLFTKRFLQARGIGVAKLYAQITNTAGLRAFNPAVLPKRFVIKPNKGYGGEGIIAIQDTKSGKYIDASGTGYSWAELTEHCLSILDGRYAISGLGDTVLFEELLEPHEYFRGIAATGLPDIRIIVFKYVPVIAMLRLPTAASNGKANLHLGAIGVGIDLGTGRGTFGVRGRNLVRKLPNGEPIRSILVPQWHDILLTASQTQYHTQIGYLAADVALTTHGVKILELNARAGLAIQISNQALLRKRLEKVSDLKVTSPSEGVRLGQTLFTKILADKKQTSAPKTTPKPIIGLFEAVNILNVPGVTQLKAKIDPHSEHTIISDSLPLPESTKLLGITIRDKKLRLPVERGTLPPGDYQIIIAGKYLSDFLIDSSAKRTDKTTPTSTAPTAEKIIKNIDQRLASLSESLHVLARLKPQNLSEAREAFQVSPHTSPQFIYSTPTALIQSTRVELRKLPRRVDHPLMPLFLEKIEEIERKLKLIEGVGQANLTERSQSVYGAVTERHYRDALRLIKQTPHVDDTSKILRIEEVIRRMERYMEEKKLSRWKIKVIEQATAGMQVTRQNTILVDKKARISENRYRALVAHEIETHIFRMENGRLQKFRLFEHGTAGYLSIEEGLAIYNQNRLHLNLGDKFFSPALNVIAIYLGMQLSFADLYHQLTDIYGLDADRAWRTCVRVKRGMTDTSQPGAFTKDSMYFVGNQQIESYVATHGAEALKKLYVGKIKISDTEYITDFRSWPIKYFPE